MSEPALPRRAQGSSRAVKRHSLSLTERDLSDLRKVRQSPSAARALGVAPDASDAAVLHAALERGLQAAREAAEEEAYRQYAEDLASDPEEQAIEAALRRRRARRESADL